LVKIRLNLENKTIANSGGFNFGNPIDTGINKSKDYINTANPFGQQTTSFGVQSNTIPNQAASTPFGQEITTSKSMPFLGTPGNTNSIPPSFNFGQNNTSAPVGQINSSLQNTNQFGQGNNTSNISTFTFGQQNKFDQPANVLTSNSFPSQTLSVNTPPAFNFSNSSTNFQFVGGAQPNAATAPVANRRMAVPKFKRGPKGRR